MAFGHGLTGIIVASVVAFTSGLAFIICFREFVRELFVRRLAPVGVARFNKTLRQNRNVLLDDNGGFVVDDDIFNQLLQGRNQNASRREWRDPSTYLFTVLFLGIVAAAGFVAGLSHFA